MPTRRSAQQLVLAACALVLTGMALVWLISHLHTRSALQQQADGLGDTLARQTALLVTELVLANDRISMNVLLNELTRNTPIAQAAVFSVDNQVIAITGPSASGVGLTASGAGSTYIAPIALQDSVAGYVRINLDQDNLILSTRQNNGLLLAAAVLMLLLTLSVMISLVRLSQRPETADTSSSIDPDTATPPGPATSRSGRSSAVLCLHIANYDALMDTYWDDTTLALPEHCYQLVEDVAELYGAHVDACDGPDIQISLPWPGDDSEQSFDALCAATLLMAMAARLHRQCDAPEALRLHAGLHCARPGEVTVINTDDEAARIAALICDNSPANGLLVSKPTVDIANAAAHFELQPFSDLDDTISGHTVEVMLIRAPAASTRALLQRQASQLQHPEP